MHTGGKVLLKERVYPGARTALVGEHFKREMQRWKKEEIPGEEKT